MKTLTKIAGLASAFALAALPALADDAPAPVVDKGDIAWMMTASVLVLFMTLPGLALFYGGLVRVKNMLSLLMQTTVVAAVMMIIWVIYGYSFAFGGSTNPFFGGFSKLFLSGVGVDSTAATFTQGVAIPEYVFIVFQMTFAAITPALIIGGFAERVKFGAVVLFCALWGTFVYFPVAHMVWDANGLVYGWGAIDFAGGTVVHINAGIAALVGALIIGPRIGLGKDMMAPHSMTLAMVGACMLWVGWFGFNVGSNLEANATAGLALINTFICTATALVTWALIESVTRGKSSMLGACSGMVAGLVAVTPACGTIGPMGAIILGVVVSLVCYFFVAVVKNKFGYDDSLDVFGIHGVGGIVGAVGTGFLTSTVFGGVGYAHDGTMGAQVITQIKAVLVTVVWSGVGSFILYKIVDMVMGLRASADDERQGLDQTSHGESAYHM
ncbi:ammonium transporter [Paenirhodobacter enshiensis]|uniref:Ammonium transporter n=1 Tax=Paenirhodobacter enshiensis TaxID=1105367 RepID=A0A086Y3B4_9RHOB|nr:ammonium transporter [Paenirhodobacter enshiensis]KFI28764.1 ammonia channel protein [Paenirhodobacter enshiensis]